MFSDIKKGDRVIISNRGGRDIVSVSSVTPKRFTAGGRTFSKEGRMIGGDIYTSTSVHLLTDELEREIIVERNTMVMKHRIKTFDYTKLTYKELSDMYNYIKGK
ncbi:MAG: hypothetical protein ACWGHH_06565 [Sulfurovaceae bacterium]